MLYGQTDGTFESAAVLNGSDGEPLILGPSGNTQDERIERICTRPEAADIDGDGDLDIVSGNFSGNFAVFEGQHGHRLRLFRATFGTPMEVCSRCRNTAILS